MQAGFFRIRRWRVGSLSSKFLLLTVPALLVSAALFVGVAYLQRQAELRQRNVAVAQAQAERDASLVERPLWNLDTALVDTIVIGLLKAPNVCRVRVVADFMDTIERRSACGGNPGLLLISTPLKIATDPARAARQGDDRMEHWFRVDPDPIEVLNDLQPLLAMLAVLVGVLILCAVLAFRYTVRVPLQRVGDSLREFRQHGVRVAVDWDSADELGEFIRAYNLGQQRSAEIEDALDAARRHAEEALQVAEAATRAKSDFLANMSHEIRTPMNAILGFASLGLRAEPPPKIQDYLKKIDNAGQHLLGVINDVLDYSKIEAGKLELEAVPFSLQQVLENIADVCAFKAAEQGLELVVAASPQTPDGLVGDPLRLGQVLLNLTGNAIKFTDRGQVVVQVECLSSDSGTARLQFSVTDTGIGMTEAHLARLFQAFSQADSSITREYGGTGLGLIISRRLVQQLGGDIAVSSRPGQGSRFSFMLDFARADQASRAPAPSPALVSGLSVLLVDDTASAREVLESQLRAFGFHVDAVASGDEALRVLRQAANPRPFDVVLMDWQMPGMDGIEVARAIQNDPTLPKAPEIIMVTAYAREEAMKAAQGVDISHFLVKPVSPSALLDSVLDSLGLNRARAATVPATGRDDAPIGLPLHGSHLLLVDDNVINQQVARELLEQAGARVTIAGNGIEAVREVESQHFDAVLMDLQMPIMDGYQATARIRQMRGGTQLTIIAMTAHAIAGYRDQCLAAGMNDYLTKPIDPRQLLAVLRQWLRPSATHAPPAPSTPAPASTPPSADMILRLLQAALPAIDVADALERVGGNCALLVRLLKGFPGEYAVYPQQVRAALAAGDATAAAQRVHALKGVSGNLSATHLYEASLMLEAAIKAGERDSLSALLDRFERATVEISNACEALGELDVLCA